MKKLGKALGAVAIAGAVIAGGSAFTASNAGVPATKTIGYSATTISGVTANSVSYTFDTPKENITAVVLNLDTDTTGKTIEIAFNGAAPVACSDAGTFDTDHTDYTCVVSQAVATATKFALVAED
jgi:hypothetical protein